MDKFVISVLELNTYVSDKLYQDPFLEEIWVRGEVTDLTVKHDIAYFVLADGESGVDCMIFDFHATGFADLIEEGQAVVVNGDVSLYRKNGRFRILVRQLELTGLGELYARFNQLKEQLAKEGLFDQERKRELPAYPQKIGIVTSQSGAAVQDIMQIVRRRNPLVAMVLYPVKVQGVDAPREITAGIAYINENTDADILIVGRGGGAAEDLFAFNDERVVRAIVGSRIPVVSAVGHETDYTLSDMAADLRAPTPSAAAELVVPVRDDVAQKVVYYRSHMARSMYERLKHYRNVIEINRRELSEDGIRMMIARNSRRIYSYRQKAMLNMNMLYQGRLLQYNTVKVGLMGMNPEATFERGYAVVTKDGTTVKNVSGLAPDDRIKVRFKDGVVHAQVQRIEVER